MSKESAVRAIVTDIEGTTSSIDFVHQTLFPYARKHLRVWLRENAGQSQVQQLINDVEAIEHEDLSIDEAADVLERWIDQDQKHTPLKALQGMIWKQGLSLYVYSSGSVEAQKLIFGHTDYGDLTPLFSGYFDTRVGGKREAASYRAILSQIQLPGEQVMFLSDVGEELDAARIAGMQTVQLIRDEKTVVAAHHRGVTDLFQAL